MQNMEELRTGATRVVAGLTVRQAEPAQHWDDRKSQSSRVMRKISPRRSGRAWQESMWNRLNREEQMTSDACHLVRPGAVAQWSAAQNGHVSVLPSGPLGRGSSQPGGCRWQKRYRMRPGRGGGVFERELPVPVTGNPLAREPNGSSPAAASQRALHRRSSPRYSIRGWQQSRLQAARRSRSEEHTSEFQS